jgi:hypothetical protein
LVVQHLGCGFAALPRLLVHADLGECKHQACAWHAQL